MSVAKDDGISRNEKAGKYLIKVVKKSALLAVVTVINTENKQQGVLTCEPKKNVVDFTVDKLINQVGQGNETPTA